MSKFKHLNLEDRITIESDLKKGLSFKKIGHDINHDCTAVSKEIKNHSTIVDDMWPTNRKHNRCIHYKDCAKKHICKYCQSVRNTRCKYCNQVCCFKFCSDYLEGHCDKLDKAPYVCNGCDNIRHCVLKKRFYYAKEAQLDYERTLSDSRSGIMISDGELKELDDLMSPLIKQGQSIYTITINNADRINWSSKTIYTYIHKGLFQARPIDLPKAVRRKTKKNKSVNHKVDTKCRKDRTFNDYLSYMDAHPEAIVCQMDTVEGRKGGKCVLTLCFPSLKFQFGFIRDHNDAHSVTCIFQHLYSIMDHDTFHLLFDVILTDNGSEFSDPSSIEALDDNGVHPHVFYCDPNRSDQKGACENDHSNFRRIVPKGTDMDSYSQELIDYIFSHINSFNRCSLNGHTPYESFKFLYGEEILNLWNIQYIEPNKVVLKPFLINSFYEKNAENHKDESK